MSKTLEQLKKELVAFKLSENEIQDIFFKSDNSPRDYEAILNRLIFYLGKKVIAET